MMTGTMIEELFALADRACTAIEEVATNLGELGAAVERAANIQEEALARLKEDDEP